MTDQPPQADTESEPEDDGYDYIAEKLGVVKPIAWTTVRSRIATAALALLAGWGLGRGIRRGVRRRTARTAERPDS